MPGRYPATGPSSPGRAEGCAPSLLGEPFESGAMFVADRVVVMGKRPARIRAIVPIDIERMRDLDDPACRMLRDEIFGVMGLDHHGLRMSADSSSAIQINVAARRMYN